MQSWMRLRHRPHHLHRPRQHPRHLQNLRVFAAAQVRPQKQHGY